MASNGEYELITKHIRNILYNKAIYHVYTQCTSRWFKSHFSPMGYKLYIARHVTHVCTHETWKRKMAQNTLYSSVLWFHLVSKFGGYYLRLYAGKKMTNIKANQLPPSPFQVRVPGWRTSSRREGSSYNQVLSDIQGLISTQNQIETWCSFRMIRLTPPPIWFY